MKEIAEEAFIDIYSVETGRTLGMTWGREILRQFQFQK